VGGKRREVRGPINLPQTEKEKEREREERERERLREGQRKRWPERKGGDEKDYRFVNKGPWSLYHEVKLQVDRYTDITWDVTYITWTEYSVCDIKCDMFNNGPLYHEVSTTHATCTEMSREHGRAIISRSVAGSSPETR